MGDVALIGPGLWAVRLLYMKRAWTSCQERKGQLWDHLARPGLVCGLARRKQLPINSLGPSELENLA